MAASNSQSREDQNDEANGAGDVPAEIEEKHLHELFRKSQHGGIFKTSIYDKLDVFLRDSNPKHKSNKQKLQKFLDRKCKCKKIEGHKLYFLKAKEAAALSLDTQRNSISIENLNSSHVTNILSNLMVKKQNRVKSDPKISQETSEESKEALNHPKPIKKLSTQELYGIPEDIFNSLDIKEEAMSMKPIMKRFAERLNISEEMQNEYKFTPRAELIKVPEGDKENGKASHHSQLSSIAETDESELENEEADKNEKKEDGEKAEQKEEKEDSQLVEKKDESKDGEKAEQKEGKEDSQLAEKKEENKDSQVTEEKEKKEGENNLAVKTVENLKESIDTADQSTVDKLTYDSDESKDKDHELSIRKPFSKEEIETIFEMASLQWDKLLKRLETNPDLINFQDPILGNYLQHWVSQKGKMDDVTKILAIRHIDYSAKNNVGQTALHVAAIYQNTEVLNGFKKLRQLPFDVLDYSGLYASDYYHGSDAETKAWLSTDKKKSSPVSRKDSRRVSKGFKSIFGR